MRKRCERDAKEKREAAAAQSVQAQTHPSPNPRPSQRRSHSHSHGQRCARQPLHLAPPRPLLLPGRRASAASSGACVTRWRSQRFEHGARGSSPRWPLRSWRGCAAVRTCRVDSTSYATSGASRTRRGLCAPSSSMACMLLRRASRIACSCAAPLGLHAHGPRLSRSWQVRGAHDAARA